MENEKIKDEYRMVELKIMLYTRGQYNALYFLRRILVFLRKHTELLKDEEYHKLYDETIVLIILHAHARGTWTVDSPEHQQRWIEMRTDIQSKGDEENHELFTKETVDQYLAYRQNAWENGERYTKEKYGFIS